MSRRPLAEAKADSGGPLRRAEVPAVDSGTEASAPGPISEPRWIRGAGWSMLPLFRRRDRIRLEPPGPELRIGQVVAFRRGDRWIVHRIVRCREATDLYLVKGDACVAWDAPLCRSQIIACVTAVRRQDRVLAIDPDPCRAALGERLSERATLATPGPIAVLRQPLYLSLFALALLRRKIGLVLAGK